MTIGSVVEERYLKLQNADKFETKCEREQYDMGQRLLLAGKVAEDGKKVVADLGSLVGGMSYALEECGVRAVSTEIGKANCKRIKERGINDDVVLCNSFRLPFRDVDALVSYMFLGEYVYPRLRNTNLSKIFRELSRSADTIYSVELKSEYKDWFKEDPETADEIKEKLSEALPDFDVEYLGEFGKYKDEHIVRGRFMDGDVALDDEHTDDRLGFKFTKKKNTSLKAKIFGWIRS